MTGPEAVDFDGDGIRFEDADGNKVSYVNDAYTFNAPSFNLQNGNHTTLATIPVPAGKKLRIYASGVNPSGVSGVNIVARNTTDSTDLYSNNSGYNSGDPLVEGAQGDTVELRIENTSGNEQLVNGFIKVEVF